MTQSNTFARASFVTALISGCVALSSPALAADGDVVPHAALSVRDVDFSSPRAVCYRTAVESGLAQIDIREQQAMRDPGARLADARADVTPAH